MRSQLCRWDLLGTGELMNFSNVVATVPAVVAPSGVAAFIYEYVGDSYV